jgi:ferrochelatase
LRALAGKGVKDVVVAPIGFVSDHMEVVYDLDYEAQKVAQELGVNIVRARTAGTHPAFVKMIRELMLERINNEMPANICAPDCCRLS